MVKKDKQQHVHAPFQVQILSLLCIGAEVLCSKTCSEKAVFRKKYKMFSITVDVVKCFINVMWDNRISVCIKPEEALIQIHLLPGGLSCQL